MVIVSTSSNASTITQVLIPIFIHLIIYINNTCFTLHQVNMVKQEFTQHGLYLLKGVYVKHMTFTECNMVLNTTFDMLGLGTAIVENLKFVKVKGLSTIFDKHIFSGMTGLVNLTFIDSRVDLVTGMFNVYEQLYTLIITNSISLTIENGLFRPNHVLNILNIENNELTCAQFKQFNGLVCHTLLYSEGNRIDCTPVELDDIEIMSKMNCIRPSEVVSTTTTVTDATITYTDDPTTATTDTPATPRTFPIVATPSARATPPSSDHWFHLSMIQGILIVTLSTIIYCGMTAKPQDAAVKDLEADASTMMYQQHKESNFSITNVSNTTN